MRCGVLIYPNDEGFAAIVRGAIEELTYSYNFTPYGSITPEATAEVFDDMFNRFCFNQGVCRVIGEIIAFAGPTSPDMNWLVCDGSSMLRADFPDLFGVIGTAYGSADGTHFNIPDLQGRSASGTGTGTGLASVTLGQQYGEQDHTLITTEIPAHSHIDTGHSHVEGNAAPAVGAAIVGVPIPSAVPTVGVTGIGNAAISATGGDAPHNNVGPRIGVTYLIVALT